MESNDQFELASRRGKALQESIPRVMSARFDLRSRRIVIRLSSNLEVSFSPRDAQGLEHATPAKLQDTQVTPSGFGIHFPKLDVDLYVPAILEGFLGSKKWMASRLGQLGGASRSKAKRAASKTNGALGGRPRKGKARHRM
jgi:hypothetical protein